MYHTAVYSESVDQATLASIAALADPVLTISGDNLQVPAATPFLGLVFGIGVNITRCQMQSPSLRRVLNPEFRPLNVLATVSTPVPVADLMQTAIPLDAGEQLQAWTAEDGAGATRMSVVVNLADKPVTPVMDNVFTVRATCAQLLVAYAWTNGALTLDQVLPVGNYAIVGARAESAGLIAFRFVFQNQTPRPGGIGSVGASQLAPVGQRHGGWGVWGTFDNWTIPTVDFFSGSADAAEVLSLDLLPVK